MKVRSVGVGNVMKFVNDDFITTEYKKTRAREEMSLYNYDAQKTGKGFK